MCTVLFPGLSRQPIPAGTPGSGDASAKSGEQSPLAGEAAGGNDFLPLESTQGGCVWSGSELTHNTLDLYSSHGTIKVKCVHVCL